MKKEKRKSVGYERRGSALGFVVVVMMAVMILITAALTLTSSYVFRNERRHICIQAELTATTAAEALVRDLEQEAETGDIGEIIEAMIEKGTPVHAALEGLDEDMGEVTLEVSYDEEKRRLWITVNTALKDISSGIVITADRRTSDDCGNEEGEGNWENFRYEKQE